MFSGNEIGVVVNMLVAWLIGKFKTIFGIMTWWPQKRDSFMPLVSPFLFILRKISVVHPLFNVLDLQLDKLRWGNFPSLSSLKESWRIHHLCKGLALGSTLFFSSIWIGIPPALRDDQWRKPYLMEIGGEALLHQNTEILTGSSWRSLHWKALKEKQ